MVKIRKIAPPTVDVYNPKGKLLGTVNENEFFDLREQICSEQLSGYYIIFQGKKIEINEDGDLNTYSEELEDKFLQPLF